MGEFFFIIDDRACDEGAGFIPISGGFVVGGTDAMGNDCSLGLPWLTSPCFEVFRAQKGWGIKNLGGPVTLALDAKEVPRGTPYTLHDGAVLMLISPDNQDYELLFYRENADPSMITWQQTGFGQSGCSRELPFAVQNGRRMVFPDRTDLPVKQYGRILRQPEEVYAGSVFMIGSRLAAVTKRNLFFTDHAAGASPDDGILKIDIEERSVHSLLRKKVLLENIHLDIRRGEMVLVLGQSGAGKTTFMDVVNGHDKAQGSVTYDHRPIEDVRADGGIGYVPQGDLLRGSVKVDRTLKSVAALQAMDPYGNGQEDLNKKIDGVLGLMGLTKQKKSLVRKLSGGEKKRLAVAGEYMGDPELFFLDEPDSGLDGASSTKLMALLRTIADEGRIVMIISHIPDRGGDLFDKIIVLGKDAKTQCGRLAFYGSRQKMMEFFGVDRIEDVMEKLENDGADQYIRRYAGSGAGRDGLL